MMPLFIAAAALSMSVQQGFLYSAGSGNALGRPDASVYFHPEPVERLGSAIASSCGYDHSMALKSDGTVWTWGEDARHQLGLGNSHSAYAYYPEQVQGLPNIVAVSAGSAHSLALASTGEVYAWGDNTAGQIGLQGGSLKKWGVPVQVTGLSNITAIAAGNIFSAALKSDGTVWVWGDNQSGELGQGTTSPYSETPVQVPGLTQVVQVAAGGQRCFAVKSDGTVYAWGNNSSGQLATGDTASLVTSPELVQGLSLIQKISLSWGHVIALRDDNMIMTWGGNYYGELGLPDQPNSYAGTSVPELVPGLTNIVDIAAGNERSFAIDSDGTAYISGITDGFGGNYSHNGFEPVQGIENAISASSGQYHSLILSNTQTPIWMKAMPSIVAGHQSATITVVNENVLDHDLDIALACDYPDLVLPTTVTIPAGSQQGSVDASCPHTVSSGFGVNLTATTGSIIAPGTLYLGAETCSLVFAGDGDAGDSFTGVINTNFNAPAGGRVFQVWSEQPQYVTFPHTVTVPEGSNRATFTIKSAPSATNKTSIFQVKSDSLTSSNILFMRGNMLAQAKFLRAQAHGGQNVDLYLKLAGPAPSGGLDVWLLQGGTEFVMPASVHFNSGETEHTISVGTNPVTQDQDDAPTIYISGYYPKVPYIKILAPMLKSIQCNPTDLIGGGNVSVTVRLDSISAGDTIKLKSTSAAIVVPTTVTIAPGAQTVSFTATTSVVSAMAHGQIQAYLRKVVVGTTVTVRPVPPAIQSLTIAPATVVGGNPSTATVTLAGPAPDGGAIVKLRSGDPAASVPASLTIPAGATSKTFTISTIAVTSQVKALISATCGESVKRAYMSIRQ